MEEDLFSRISDLILLLLKSTWQERTRRIQSGWVKDEVLTDEILKCLDSTEGPDYVYTISVQGHGAYPDEQILEDPEITVSGAPTEEENNKWEYYVNEIHEMDNL